MASGSGRAGAPSRSQQAFAWLLENERDASADGGSRQRPKAGGSGGGRSTKGKGGQQKSSGSSSKPPFIPGFKLRCEAEAEAAGTAQHPADELTSLQEAFRSVLDGDVVADVLVSCGGDTAAASEALLALAGSGSSGDAQAEPAGAKQPQRAAAEEPRLLASERPAASGGPCYWDVLPAEIKALVFEQLSLRDLARAARACCEFATYVREQRRSLRTVVVPEGVSLTAVRGLVASFAGASGVALWRCAAQLRFQHEFEEMLRAVALGESDRQSGVPVSEISLARCGTATDAAVGAVCDTLGHLQRVDLSRCVEVSDAAMVRLAAYTRQPEFDSDADDEDWVDAAGGAAAASEAIGGLQLAPEEAATPPGSNAGTAPGSTPAMESPDSAVRRIAAQHHAAMLVRSAAAARAQHGRPPRGGLQELVLKETSVSARGIKLLLQPGSATAKSLKVLDVSRCANLGSDALDVHPRCTLEVLRAAGCNALRSVVIQLPSEAPLRSLSLEGCRQLRELVLVAHRLEAAAFSHCGQLRHVSLRCRRLRELRAVNCGNFNLTASELHCPVLQEANFFGCRQLDAEGIEAAASSLAKCVHLELTGCTSLSRLLLPDSTALQSVRRGRQGVSGCGLLRQVLLASPALTRFKAAGCSRLIELRLGTVNLGHLDLTSCGHLREVQLSEASSRTSLDRQGAAWQQEGGPPKQKRALMLKGCTSLPEEAKKRLRDAVLGC